MLNTVITVSKLVALHLIKKYAAELVFDHVLAALDKAANKTETNFDNELVEKVKNEREIILTIIKGS